MTRNDNFVSRGVITEIALVHSRIVDKNALWSSRKELIGSESSLPRKT